MKVKLDRKSCRKADAGGGTDRRYGAEEGSRADSGVAYSHRMARRKSAPVALHSDCAGALAAREAKFALLDAQ